MPKKPKKQVKPKYAVLEPDTSVVGAPQEYDWVLRGLHAKITSAREQAKDDPLFEVFHLTPVPKKL